MFYHVLIEVANIAGTKQNLELFEYDYVNRDVIIEEFYLPYLNNKEFQFQGYFLKPKDVVKILVKSSRNSIDEIVSEIEETHPPEVIWFVTRETAFSSNQHTTDVSRSIKQDADKIRNDHHKDLLDIPEIKINNKKIFIVHGHDEVAKLSVALLLKRLNLEPIILHEQASGGATIIEKIEANSDVGYGIVLYTPCDVGKSHKEDKLNVRARQNVIFEHGYLISKLGRSRVCAMVKEGIEKPNDVSGVVYIKFDDSNGWHNELVKELKNAGYQVDANKLFTN